MRFWEREGVEGELDMNGSEGVVLSRCMGSLDAEPLEESFDGWVVDLLGHSQIGDA